MVIANHNNYVDDDNVAKEAYYNLRQLEQYVCL
jgi:hypothetical protein